MPRWRYASAAGCTLPILKILNEGWELRSPCGFFKHDYLAEVSLTALRPETLTVSLDLFDVTPREVEPYRPSGVLTEPFRSLVFDD